MKQQLHKELAEAILGVVGNEDDVKQMAAKVARLGRLA
jgi:hypothetical protein